MYYKIHYLFTRVFACVLPLLLLYPKITPLSFKYKFFLLLESITFFVLRHTLALMATLAPGVFRFLRCVKAKDHICFFVHSCVLRVFSRYSVFLKKRRFFVWTGSCSYTTLAVLKLMYRDQAGLEFIEVHLLLPPQWGHQRHYYHAWAEHFLTNSKQPKFCYGWI